MFSESTICQKVDNEIRRIRRCVATKAKGLLEANRDIVAEAMAHALLEIESLERKPNRRHYRTACRSRKSKETPKPRAEKKPPVGAGPGFQNVSGEAFARAQAKPRPKSKTMGAAAGGVNFSDCFWQSEPICAKKVEYPRRGFSDDSLYRLDLARRALDSGCAPGCAAVDSRHRAFFAALSAAHPRRACFAPVVFRLICRARS